MKRFEFGLKADWSFKYITVDGNNAVQARHTLLNQVLPGWSRHLVKDIELVNVSEINEQAT